ncbi:AmpG family muropeptide MFS transporter [Steroidobacter sp.]|uniref:AmpG family muropeptide MFS transporter n=1 Tax=Steroidobacter sp. TaxID=1978227 RepID=UPI001A611E23|nr:MFS transporter [Steroidobacter sp.]MBL8268420.1 MFS transporter [Steroidobacter sp.]
MSTAAANTTQAAPADKPRWRDILASPKMIAIMALGAASGFPNQITESALQAWLKDSGATNTTIGVLSYVALPYLFKFLWAPVVDRYPLPLLGRRRGWIMLTQLALAVAIGVFALQNPSVSLAPIAICAVVIVFFSATQDIAIDAYRTDVSQPHERGLAAAATNLGYRTSAWVASAFALIVADFFGWKPAFLILGAVMAAFCVATLLAPEPHYEHQPPRSLRESLVVPLRELLGTPSAIAFIALVILFKVGDAFALRLFTPFMMDVGFTKTEIALVLKALFTASAIVGAILGGVAMVRLGLLKSMLIFGVLQAASNFLYYALALTGKNYPLMVMAVSIDNIAGAMGNIAAVALIMALCDVRYSAFQYALLSAFALTPRYVLGGPAGWLADKAGWDTYYVVSVLLALPGLLLVWLMRNQIKQLDQPRP